MNDWNSLSRGKGATLSSNTAMKEYGLTETEIVKAMQSGALQYRETSIYGNPSMRFLRLEVEALVAKKRGGNYLKDQKAKTELASINLNLKRLKAQIVKLEERKGKLLAGLA